MLFFLSSSARNQYAEDILRAIALPAGSRLRLRYDLSLVEGHSVAGDNRSLAKQITESASSFKNSSGLICFLDSGEKRRPVTIYPCRMCKVISLEVFGPILMCYLEMRDFCSSKAPNNFTEKLTSDAHSPVPVWVEGDAEPKLRGAWVFDRESDLSMLSHGDDFSSFASACDTLAGLNPFYAGETDTNGLDKPDTLNPFWNVSLYKGDIRADGSSTARTTTLAEALKLKSGEYILQGGEQYTLRILHYFPASGRKKKDFDRAVDADFSSLDIDGTSTLSMPIKSEYDVKDVVIRPKRAPLERVGFIDIALRNHAAGKSTKFSDVGIPVRIERSLTHTTLNVVLIGLGFVIPAIIASSYREGFSFISWQVFFIALSGIIGGIAAVFGLRRSV